MGQRLNIEIIQNNETLANAYYHWSAYTSSSLELTKMILENIDKIQHEDEVIRAVRLLETTGALLQSDEIEAMDKRNQEEPFQIATSRNEGLISISKEGMGETRRWEEGRVDIHLDKEVVNFSVFWDYEKESYMEDYEVTEEEYLKLPIKEYNFSEIPFSEFNQIADDVIQVIKNRNYAVRLENGDVLSFVE